MVHTWKNVKEKIPPSLHARKKDKINKDLYAYVRQWQWRSRNSNCCLLKATAKKLKDQTKLGGEEVILADKGA